MMKIEIKGVFWMNLFFSGQCETNSIDWYFYLVSQGGELFYESYKNKKKKKYLAIKQLASMDFPKPSSTYNEYL